jgi:uncharacterized protein YprB with RNaseH-like and TPR domain
MTVRKNKIEQKWKAIDAEEGISTKEKLEKLVNLSLRREKKQSIKRVAERPVAEDKAFIVREFSYPLHSQFGDVSIGDWLDVSPEYLAVISGDPEFLNVEPTRLLYFDTETTGISGGTGTIPFLLGFGYLDEHGFQVKIFILNDLSKEDEFLDAADTFLGNLAYSATVTYNGKGFDFPLMETRYILQRKRFPLLKKPHLDFLYPARTIWKYTYETRKLGYLGDILLGISREEDIDASQIPSLYFNYLRGNMISMIDKVVEHNALDLLGLSALLLLGIHYLKDITCTNDEGEILGTARIYEKFGDLERAGQLFDHLKSSGTRENIVAEAVKRLSLLKKKRKLYQEAVELWEMLLQAKDSSVYRELSVHYEHREKNYFKALEFVEAGLDRIDLSEAKRRDLEKRFKRLKRKIDVLEDNE